MSGEAIERAMAELNAEIGACEGLRDIKVELSQENARALRTALASREQQEPQRNYGYAVLVTMPDGHGSWHFEYNADEAEESTASYRAKGMPSRVVPLIGAEPAQP